MSPDHREGHGDGGGSSSMLPLGAGATTALEVINLLSAPQVEYERPFYCIEKGEQEAQQRRQHNSARHATIRGSSKREMA